MKTTLLPYILFIFLSLSFSCYSQLFSSKKNISSTGSSPFVIQSGNLDNDNLPDILIGTLSSTVEWYKNNGDATFSKQKDISNNLRYVKSVAIADLDLDNHNDIIAISNIDNQLVWFKNDGNGNFGSAKLISSALDRPVVIKTGKFDNNNSIDIAVADYEGNQIVCFTNNGSGNFSSGKVIITPPVIAKPGDIDLADYDKDGDLDVVVAYSQTKNVFVYYNDLGQTGLLNFTTSEFVAGGISGITDVSFSDIDNNNQLDILVVAGSSNIVNWYSREASENHVANSITSSNMPYNALVGDLNNNNKQDIVLSYASTNVADQISYFESSNSGTFMTESIIDNTQDDIIFTINDFDNDGDLDIASVAKNESTLSWFENQTINSKSLSNSNFETTPIKFYPNPTKSVLYFENLHNSNKNITIYNILGRKVMSSKINNSNTLDVSKLSNGLYIIRFIETNTSVKFIKE
ncbi:T9SS type A sorting domain-containing protein [Aestuariibaculum sp. YM273]|uniref:T9SS type A sorting domain-containing protein n=1 Tax=Aestuariibaculum sp. YM273 TaxID=3070659 RepID=UPI0027DBD76C|nr:T9SS type A sorting domain-containing protein [Aestuariibaculum sp. YM273]WMI65043.1 T9SS type A sorting domain-containing protein [Aestuariibaculum sp. YM273]